MENEDGSIRRIPDIVIKSPEYFILIENKVSLYSIDNKELEDQAILGREEASTRKFLHILLVPSRNLKPETIKVIKENNILCITWRDISEILKKLSQKYTDSFIGTILSQYQEFVEEHFVLRFPQLDASLLRKLVLNMEMKKDEKEKISVQIRTFWERVEEEVRGGFFIPELHAYIEPRYHYLFFYPPISSPLGPFYEIYAQFWKDGMRVGLASFNKEARRKLREWVRNKKNILQSMLPDAWILADPDDPLLKEWKEKEDMAEEDIIRERITISFEEPVDWKEIGLRIAEKILHHLRTYYSDLKALFS